MGCPIDQSPRQRRARRERRNEEGEAKERAENQRSGFSPYGAILTSTRGGFWRSAQPLALHALLIADFSAASTLRPQRNFTPTQPTRYVHVEARYGGSQLAGSRSPFEEFTLSVTARRDHETPRSFANASRRDALHLYAPDFHASLSATTWSMSTSVLIVQVRLSYRLSHLPVRTIPPEIVTLTLDSSMSTSARVSSPSPSASIQSLPPLSNLLLLYPLEYSGCTFSRPSAVLRLMRAVGTSAAVDAGALSAMKSATRTGASRWITS